MYTVRALLYIFYPIFSGVYNQERLILKTICVCTKQGNVGLKSAVYDQERFQIKGYNGVFTVICYFVRKIWYTSTRK